MFISIKTKDEHIFKMSLENVLKSYTIKSLLGLDDISDIKDIKEEDITSDEIPLDISLDILTKINVFLDKNNGNNNENEQDWNNTYIADFNDEVLFDIILAANYLDIKDLLDLSCKRVADDIKKCKTPQEIRRRYNIKNDFTPEEEEEIRKENAWCQDI